MNKLREAFEDNGAFLGVYFILNESRSEPPMRRGHLMINASALLEVDSEPRKELNDLASELLDCEQEAQRLIGEIRKANADILSSNTALEYLLTRLEDADLATKFAMTDGTPLDMGLRDPSHRGGCGKWIEAYAHYQEFERKLDLFMFRLRTRHWECSNADAMDAGKPADSDVGARRKSAA